MSRSLKDHYPDAAALIRVEREDLAGYILEHLHTLSPNQLRQASSHNIANELSRSYLGFDDKIYKAIFSACQWLIKNDFLEEISPQGFFTFSENGRPIKTLIEFQAYLSEGKAAAPQDFRTKSAKGNDMSSGSHLNRLIKAYQAAGGSQRKVVNLVVVLEDEELSQAEIHNEIEYMKGEGWVVSIAHNAPSLIRLTHEGIKTAQSPDSPASNTTPEIHDMTTSKDTQVVFVVHGRNLEARDALFRFLRSIGLKPLEWSQAIKATGKASPFIGEILDIAFSKAQAVVVLLTPDDEVWLREPFRIPHDPPYESQLSGQARPNVLFEAGMAMGRNPDRTVIIELGTLRPFSDIGGRHTVRLSNNSAARQELAQRLETAGCPVDLSGRDWHTEGDFDSEPLNPITSKSLQDAPNQPDEHDRQLFAQFQGFLPSRSESIRFLCVHDSGVSFPSKWLDPLYNYINQWSDAEHEFNSPELEKKRLEFWNSLNTFLKELGNYASSTGQRGWLSIGLEDMEDRPEMLEAHERLNNLGTVAYEAHQNLVREGKRLGISIKT